MQKVLPFKNIVFNKHILPAFTDVEIELVADGHDMGRNDQCVPHELLYPEDIRTWPCGDAVIVVKSAARQEEQHVTVRRYGVLPCGAVAGVDMLDREIGRPVAYEPVQAAALEDEKLVGQRRYSDDWVASRCSYLRMAALHGRGGFYIAPVVDAPSVPGQYGIVESVRFFAVPGGKEPAAVHGEIGNGHIGAALLGSELGCAFAVVFYQRMNAVGDNKAVGGAYLRHDGIELCSAQASLYRVKALPAHVLVGVNCAACDNDRVLRRAAAVVGQVPYPVRAGYGVGEQLNKTVRKAQPSAVGGNVCCVGRAGRGDTVLVHALVKP